MVHGMLEMFLHIPDVNQYPVYDIGNFIPAGSAGAAQAVIPGTLVGFTPLSHSMANTPFS